MLAAAWVAGSRGLGGAGVGLPPSPPPSAPRSLSSPHPPPPTPRTILDQFGQLREAGTDDHPAGGQGGRGDVKVGGRRRERAAGGRPATRSPGEGGQGTPAMGRAAVAKGPRGGGRGA